MHIQLWDTLTWRYHSTRYKLIHLLNLFPTGRIVFLTFDNKHKFYFFQDCLSTSLAAHDTMYQTKALVSIASLFLEAGETHQAIVFYEKLLDLEQELTGNTSTSKHLPKCPNFYTKYVKSCHNGTSLTPTIGLANPGSND